MANEIEIKAGVRKIFSTLEEPGIPLQDNVFRTMGTKLATFAEIAPGDRVLDVAAGRGAIANNLPAT